MEHESTVFPEQHNTIKHRTIKYITIHCAIQLSIVHNIKAHTHNITQNLKHHFAVLQNNKLYITKDGKIQYATVWYYKIQNNTG